MLLVTGSALGFALWADAQSDRVTVLVATSDIATGDAIDRIDVREVSISLAEGMAVVPASELSKVVGRIAQGPIPTGSLIAPGDLGDDFGVPEGQAVVGASLHAGAYPIDGLSIGDPVQLYAVSANQNDDEAEVFLGTGAVWAVEPIELGGEPRIFLSVLVDGAVAGATTNAEAHGRLHVVLTGRPS